MSKESEKFPDATPPSRLRGDDTPSVLVALEAVLKKLPELREKTTRFLVKLEEHSS
ncbi:MAG TPA: hypothetical protein VI957_03585 [Candidatus Paceibacterota bacterium]